MENITFYSFSNNKAQDQRIVNEIEALEVLDGYKKNLKVFYEDPEKALEDSLFGFSYNSHDFIEICLDSHDTFRIKLECKYKKNLWFLYWRSLYQKEYESENIDDLKRIISEFFTAEIKDFKGYFDSLSLKISPPMRMG